MNICKNRAIHWILVLTAILTTALFPAQAMAAENQLQANNGNAQAQTGNLEKELSTGDLEKFVDQAFLKNMGEYNIPGAVISVVKDGKQVFSKGYGYSDTSAQKPADPDKTLFRIGSASKLFTATAVMKLVQEGRIDLHADVNQYLKSFKLKNPYSKPVTMEMLLGHTSGIDSDEIGDLSMQGSVVVKPLDQVLGKRMLPVVREPGTLINYSSYGIALAGSIAENVSGINCRDYITQNIIQPLDMESTSFELNPAGLAQGYNATGDGVTSKNLTGYFNLYPVGGVVSTAEDMSHFMIAHLNDGEYNGKQILDKATVQMMQSRHAGFDPVLPGTCLGFYEQFINGQRAISHAGYSEDGFSTELSLFPQYNLGIFVSVNQGSNNSFPQDFTKIFMDRYYPLQTCGSAEVQKAGFPTNDSVAGIYRFGEYTYSTVQKGDLLGVGQDATVTVEPDGSISLQETDPFTGKNTVLNAKQVSPLVYKTADGDYAVFKKDSGGKTAYMALTSDSWHGTYEKISWYDENTFQIGLFVSLMGLALFEAVVWLVFLIRHHKKGISQSKTAAFLTHAAGVTSLLNLSFFLVSMATWGTRLRYGVPLDIMLLLVIPNITAILTVLTAVFFFIVAFKKKEKGKFLKINTTVALALGIAFIWFNNYWNFIGFRV